MLEKIKQIIFGPEWEVHLRFYWPDDLWVETYDIVRARSGDLAKAKSIKIECSIYEDGWNKIEVLSVEKSLKDNP